ncbi:E3 ubiquitin-protein ligase AMFR [Halotydeus destructor]|nr:E3 ubiquitin-protein ligase AMFR [Halotydeus destructor]
MAEKGDKSSFFSKTNLVTGLVGGLVGIGAAYYLASQAEETKNAAQAYSHGQGSKGKCPPQPCDQCAICLENLTAPLELLPCSHVYHKNCIKQWYAKDMTCPLCKGSLSRDQQDVYKKRLDL